MTFGMLLSKIHPVNGSLLGSYVGGSIFGLKVYRFSIEKVFYPSLTFGMSLSEIDPAIVLLLARMLHRRLSKGVVEGAAWEELGCVFFDILRFRKQD